MKSLRRNEVRDLNEQNHAGPANEGKPHPLIARSLANEEGAGLVEYCLLVAMIAVATIVSVRTLSDSTRAIIFDSEQVLSGAACGEVGTC
jgi:Flp pilus assembly pilin Flp